MTQRVDLGQMRHGTELLKRGFAKMQEGGVIMDVVNAKEAHIAEDAGAVSVMALERVPADIRSSGLVVVVVGGRGSRGVIIFFAGLIIYNTVYIVVVEVSH